MPDGPSGDFRAFSARCGRDPLRVQGPGGNTSMKIGDVLWIKASGTQLADAEDAPIFVAVDHAAARRELRGVGDGTCHAAVIDKSHGLRPSIETTFHALIDWPVVAHTHSVSTLVHAISPEGRMAAKEKLAGLPVAFVPYRKPGLPLTKAIADAMTPETQVFILANHGLIIAGPDVTAVDALMADVEARLDLPPAGATPSEPANAPPAGHSWISEVSNLAIDRRTTALAFAGSYYPDHVVFLGPALRNTPESGRPAFISPGIGLALRDDATPAQRAMVQCLHDVLARLPKDWTAEPLGHDAEAELLDWDAEKYRQALAARKH